MISFMRRVDATDPIMGTQKIVSGDEMFCTQPTLARHVQSKGGCKRSYFSVNETRKRDALFSNGHIVNKEDRTDHSQRQTKTKSFEKECDRDRSSHRDNTGVLSATDATSVDTTLKTLHTVVSTAHTLSSSTQTKNLRKVFWLEQTCFGLHMRHSGLQLRVTTTRARWHWVTSGSTLGSTRWRHRRAHQDPWATAAWRLFSPPSCRRHSSCKSATVSWTLAQSATPRA